MILTESVTIKTHTRLKKYYENLGYDISGEFVTVLVIDLTYNSKYKISVKCDICGKEKMLSYYKYNKNIKKYNYYSCSAACSYNKVKETNIEKYGVDSPMKNPVSIAKKIATCLEKYGVDYPSMCDGVKDKIYKTNYNKYGVKTVLQLVDTRDKLKVFYNEHKDIIDKKRKNTCLEKYGVDSPAKNEDIINKIKNTHIINSGISNGRTGKSLELYSETIHNNFVNKYNDYDFLSVDFNTHTLSLFCDKCNEIYSIKIQQFRDRYIRPNIDMCTLCNPIGSYSDSNSEKDLYNFIKENYDGEIIQNDRKLLNGLELDIYLPDMNIAVEYNGIYWHSNYYKASDYHLNKSNLCEQLGINLVHIYEDDWKGYKNNIIKTNILKLLGKNCIYLQPNEHYNIIENIDNDICKQFVDENSITSIDFLVNNISLYIGDILVAIMFFDNDNISHCEHIDYNGSLHILFDYIIKKYNFNKIDIYIDRSWPLVDEYLKLGFTIAENMEPIKYYVSGCNRTDTITDMYIYDSGKFKLTYNKL